MAGVRAGPLLHTSRQALGVVGAMGCGLLRNEKGRIRYYYSGRTAEEPRGGICLAESDDGLHWVKPKLGQMKMAGEDSNRLHIDGLPDLNVRITTPDFCIGSVLGTI